jgi:hypothetical protein
MEILHCSFHLNKCTVNTVLQNKGIESVTFSDRHWEMLSKTFGRLLGTFKTISERRWEML